jgi:CS domain
VPVDIPILSPATQWAQSVKEVYLRVKFATRTDSPACLEISELEHTIQEKRISISALCRNDKKFLRYKLDLPLENAVNADKSSVEVESVGRILVKLEKAAEIYWNALWTSDYQRPKNLGLGWEMQSRYDEELKNKFPEEFKDLEESKTKGVFSAPTETQEDAEEEVDEAEVKKPKKKKKQGKSKF